MTSRTTATLLSCLLTLGAAACGSGGVTSPVTVDGPASFEVALSSSKALVSSPVTITATVRKADGAPVAAGTAVGFVATGGTLLATTPTDAAGHAKAVLTSASHGEVTVFVTAGTLAGQAASVTFIDPNLPFAVSVTPSATQAAVRGSVRLTATVLPTGADGAGGPGGAIPDGTLVTFFTSAGTLSAVSTTVRGEATATLGEVNAPAVVLVSASAGGVASPPAVVSFSDPDVPSAVSVTANPASGYTDGQRSVTLTADVVSVSGGPVPAGTSVAFAITAGSGHLSAASGLTDTLGLAAVVLDSSVEGPVTVSATVAATLSGRATVIFTNPSRPVAVQLSANPAAGQTSGQRSVTLTADVAAASGGPVPAGTLVAFSVTAGSGSLSATSVATDAAGRASVVLDSAAEGSVTVTASVAGPLSRAVTVVFTNPSRPVAVLLSANPASGYTDGQRSVTLTADVTAASGGPVPAGTAVAFSVTAGPGRLSAATAAADAAGRATVVLDATAEGPVTVSATAGGTVVGRATVTFTNPSRPAAVQLSASPAEGVTNGQRLVTLSATVTPADPVDGRIPDGTSVRFFVLSGAGILSAPAVATSGGVATLTLDSATAGSVTVSARVGSAPEISSNNLTATFIAQPTLAIVKVRTTGALPPGSLIGGVSAVVVSPPGAGLTLSASDVSATGAGAGSMLVANPANPAAAILALVSASGIQAGEFATLVFHVAPGQFPVASDFGVVLSGPGVIDAAGTTIPLGVAVQGVTIQ